MAKRRKVRLPHGARTVIAQRLGVSVTAVASVAKGKATSARISAAIAEWQNEQRTASQHA